MKLNITLNNNEDVSTFVEDKNSKDLGKMVNEIVNLKLNGGTMKFGGNSVSTTEIKAITIEFE